MPPRLSPNPKPNPSPSPNPSPNPNPNLNPRLQAAAGCGAAAAAETPLARLEVVAGKAHAPSCLLEGEGLSRAAAHSPADIIVTVRDAAGNVNTRGGDKLSLSLVSKPGSHVHIRTQVRIPTCSCRHLEYYSSTLVRTCSLFASCAYAP